MTAHGGPGLLVDSKQPAQSVLHLKVTDAPPFQFQMRWAPRRCPPATWHACRPGPPRPLRRERQSRSYAPIDHGTVRVRPSRSMAITSDRSRPPLATDCGDAAVRW